MSRMRFRALALVLALLLTMVSTVLPVQAAGNGQGGKAPQDPPGAGSGKPDNPGKPENPGRPADPGNPNPGNPGNPRPSPTPSAGCPTGAPVKFYDVLAIDVEITLNRWGDHDPLGKMYVLAEDLPAVRAKEADNRQARLNNTPGPDQGLLDDPIQPLTLRANLGDCVEIRFTNQLAEPASMHIQSAAQVIKDTGEAATAANPDAIAAPNQTVTYQWYIDPAFNQERTLHIKPAGNMRTLNDHGLFGALIVEPAGSRYLHNKTSAPLCRNLGSAIQTCQSDWRAMIDPGTGPDFREHVIFYHEVGDDTYRPLDRKGSQLPIVGGLTGSYGVGRFALNYRSEPHETRLQVQKDLTGEADESMAYSSYFFGDPAVPIVRSYVGDPTKIRLVHGSGETFHVHHLHGGAIRWPRQPGVSDPVADFAAGLRKSFPGFPASMYVDSQALGPSETFDTVPYCGAGGCQQGAGDYVFHCHVGHHYLSGMWTFWRVYNTLRVDGEADPSDHLGALAELPDRAGRVARAVTSEGLVGRTVMVGNTPVTVTAENLADVVERHLPPQGVPVGYDASVLDWVREGNTYYNEPNDTRTFANHTPLRPGERPAVEFDPLTGKLAYPFLRPHFLKRPPFAPGHGPAPYFDPAPGADLPEPGANGPTSLCPTGAPRRFFDIVAAPVEVPMTRSGASIDGLLYMLREERADILAGRKPAEPLAIRGNEGDCVDFTFVNGVPDDELGGFSKVNLHQHLVQFDIQANDGVVVGANYETSLRPYQSTGQALTAAAPAGADTLTVAGATGLHPGTLVMIGIDRDGASEVVQITGITGNVLTLDRPLRLGHAAGELVSPEFMRYRYYLDMQLGHVYFHDHVKGLETWPRGLIGAIVVEPRGSTYHDPRTGAEIRSGTLADIRTAAPVTPDMSGSFREAVAFLMDAAEGTETAVNLRAEPIEDRLDEQPGASTALAFSSVTHGDPFTLLPRAYAGDPTVFRVLTASANELNTFRLSGHTFRLEAYQPDEVEYRSAMPSAISERETIYLPSAGGPLASPGDYLWSMGDFTQMVQGAWGIFRVHDARQPDLQPLPGRNPPSGPGFPYLAATGGTPPAAAGPGNTCPVGAPERQFQISAIEVDIPLGNGDTWDEARIYVLDSDIEAVRSGQKPIEPLAIRANKGDCVVIQFTNRLPEGPASLHVDELSVDPQGSQGITVGLNPNQAVDPGQSITLRLYAGAELGTAVIQDFGNMLENPMRGLYGVLIIEPAGSTYLDPVTGEELQSGNQAIIANPSLPDFREFVLQMHDEDTNMGLHVMPYRTEVRGLALFNYRAEPLEERLDRNPDTSVLFSGSTFGDPATPVLRALAGDPVRFRVSHPFGEQAQVFALEGHQWPMTPLMRGSALLSSYRLGSGDAFDAILVGGAGGPQGVAGDYMYLNQRLPYLEAGMWGIMRVLPPGSSDLRPLPDRE